MSSLVSEETLDQMAFERSKWWSNFLKDAEKNEAGVAIHIDDIESVYANDAEEGEWTDFEEAEEDEASEAVPEKGLMDISTAQEKKSFIESTEVQDILNATIPVLKEHQRKWEEAGLDRVLQTFDSVRIEREVGGWMRRNHTQPCGKTSIPSQKRYTTGSDTDSDSLLSSSETASYVRSTRRKCQQRSSRTSMASIGRFKRFHKLHHRYETGTVIETTMYRNYNCSCGIYNRDDNGNARWSQPQQRRRSSDAKELACSRAKDNALKYDFALLPQSERRIQRKEDTSSSDSDCAKHERNRIISRRALPRTCAVESRQRKQLELCRWMPPPPLEDFRNRLSLANTSQYETPCRSSFPKRDFTKTAPSNVSEKRQLAWEALEELHGKNTRKHETQTNRDSSSENDITFKNDLQKAIALSLKISEIAPKPRKSTLNPSQLRRRRSSAENMELVPLNKFNSITEDKKENTFLTKQENICNSTALSTATPAAARQQMPSISEDPVNSTKFNEAKGMRKKSIGPLSTKNKKLLFPSPASKPLAETIIKSGMNSIPSTPTAEQKFLDLTGSPTAVVDKQKPSISEDPVNSTKFNEAKGMRKKSIGPLSTKNKKLLFPSPASKPLAETINKTSRNSIPSTPTKQNFIDLIDLHPAVVDKKNVSPPATERGCKSFFNGRKSTIDANNVSTLNCQGVGETNMKKQRILIYKPPSNAPVNGEFQVTKELLKTAIGTRRARRFLKYNIGPLTFSKTSTIYFCPPENELNTSDSDDDPTENIGLFGELCELK